MPAGAAAQVDGTDLILGVPIRFGLGLALDTGLMPHPNTFYWGGYGGSLAIIDMDARTTIAYAMNKMSGTTTGDFRALGLAMAFWEASTA
jgi:CubicO group peptidase (beta-lactamase class C family)